MSRRSWPPAIFTSPAETIKIRACRYVSASRAWSPAISCRRRKGRAHEAEAPAAGYRPGGHRDRGRISDPGSGEAKQSARAGQTARGAQTGPGAASSGDPQTARRGAGELLQDRREDALRPLAELRGGSAAPAAPSAAEADAAAAGLP